LTARKDNGYDANTPSQKARTDATFSRAIATSNRPFCFNALGALRHTNKMLDTCQALWNILPVSPKPYTTQRAADTVKITRQTLQTWIAKGKLKAPETQLRNGRAVRLWTEADIARLRKVKGEIYMKELGRPSKNGKK
jgi:hypothetical protein